MAIHMSAIKTNVTHPLNTAETPGEVNKHIADMSGHNFELVTFTTTYVPGERETRHLVHSFIWTDTSAEVVEAAVEPEVAKGPRGVL